MRHTAGPAPSLPPTPSDGSAQAGNKVCAGLVFRPGCGKIAPGHGRRQTHSTRRVVPPPGGRVIAHARGGGDDLRGRASRPTRSCSSTSRGGSRSCRASARSCASSRYGQGRPVWVDDPHFNLEYHVRTTALPPPGSEEQLKHLASRVFAQQLDRTKPMWEIWLVQGLGRGSNGDSADAARAAVRAAVQDAPRARRRRRRAWTSRRCCSTRRPSPRRRRPAVRPGCRAPSRRRRSCSARRCSSAPPAGRDRALGARRRSARRARIAGRALESAVAIGALARPAWARPPRSLNVDIGPHRRFDWVRADLELLQGDQERARRHRQRRRAGGGHRARCARFLEERGEDVGRRRR